MMSWWYALVDALLPFSWAQHLFMKHALLAVVLGAPLLGTLGTLVVNQRMAFFSDTIGHGALMGLAIGVVLGLGDPLWAMLAFAAALAVGIHLLQRASQAAMDTVTGVCMAFAVAGGIVVLSRGGSFRSYLRYLTGDFLSITPGDLAGLAALGGCAAVFLALTYNRILLVSLNPSLARSRGVRVGGVQLGFTVLVALVVTLHVPWVGVLVVNALLVLPAAAARTLARNSAQYAGLAVLFSLVSGVGGLIGSYYLDTATGASIALLAVACFVGAALVRLARG